MIHSKTISVGGSLDIRESRDLSIPYQSECKYVCDGSTLSVDDLPSGFTLHNNILTFSGVPTTVLEHLL
ncbi:MAG: hypothetical protein LBD63_04170 [Mycoplasmataceae bacterium]|nr:hypothetical protein [Mycoplasmataceae bacterium]